MKRNLKKPAHAGFFSPADAVFLYGTLPLLERSGNWAA